MFTYCPSICYIIRTISIPYIWSRGNDLDLYLGGAMSESQSGYWLYWLRFFYGFPQSLQENVNTLPRLGYDHFLPNPFQLISYYSFYNFTLYSLYTESVLKTPEKNKTKTCQ
jgi:hypothetical protein